MKIFIVINQNPFCFSSASANRWLNLIEGLSQYDAKVELLIYGGYQSDKEAEDWNLSGEKLRIKYKYIGPLLIKGYWKTRYYTYIGKAIRMIHLKRLIFKELQNEEGIIWTDSSLDSFKLAVNLKEKLYNYKLILELSEFLDIYKYNKGNFLQRLQGNKLQKFFEEKAFYAYDGMALMTKTLMQHYNNFPRPVPKLLHLPMTVDLERFDADFPLLEGFVQPYIAFVGVMNDAKDGVNILIEAFAKIHKNFPEHKLYLVGAWNYDTPLHQKQIKEYDLQNKAFWQGEFSRHQIPAIIKNASLLVLPRPDSKQAQGGFPTKLGEYLATGNPVCATTVGEIPDYLVEGESVYFAEPGSVDSFADTMKRALSNPEKAKTIGANGRKVAEKKFNKDIQGKILYDFFRAL